MNSEDRLNRSLAARAAPGRDMHFTIQVMRRAEAERFRAAMARRLLWGAGGAALAAAALLPIAGWAAGNADVAFDAALAVGGLVALTTLFRGLRRQGAARTH